MTKQLCCLCAAVLSLAAIPCLAGESPWDGTWKLNPAKSQMAGEMYTITKDGGMYTFNNGNISYKFACDGKDYPVISNRTAACTMSGSSIHWVFKANGKVLETENDQISSDGKTLTSVTTGTRPDGTHYTDHETDLRAGSGSGLAGTWKQTKVSSSASSMFRVHVNGDTLHSEDPGFKSSYDAKLDGTPAAITGGNAPPGLMVSAKLEGKKIVMLTTLSGKKLYAEEWSLSPDGKVLTDVGWMPGQESHKQTYIYDRE